MLICEWNNIWHCYAEESVCSPTFDDKIDISLKKLSQITKVSVILDRRTLRNSYQCRWITNEGRRGSESNWILGWEE